MRAEAGLPHTGHFHELITHLSFEGRKAKNRIWMSEGLAERTLDRISRTEKSK